jgi:hypothetical protein
MPAQVFISYRSADGKDKATALARDLGAVFGHDTIFLDKDDLSGGRNWREEVAGALGQRPVLLLLVTPQLVNATDAQGRPRLLDESDPVKRELEQALAAGARVIPVLGDGLGDAPDATTWPTPLNQLAELTWRRLRAYDWAADVQRLAQDLRAHGVAPVMAVDAVDAAATRWRRPLLAAAALVLVAALGLGAWLARPDPNSLAGRWQVTWVRGEQTVLVFTQQGSEVAFTSEPVDVSQRADWAAYRTFWRERGGGALRQVVYRGAGTLRRDPGVPALADIALKVVAVPGNEDIDSGNLTFSFSGEQGQGKQWLNGEQAEHAATLKRLR